MELEELVKLRPSCPKCGEKMYFLYADKNGLVIYHCKECKRSFHYQIIEEKLLRVD